MLAAAGLVGEVDIDPMMILHGEQGVVLHRPLPPRADVEVHGRLTAIWDKGKAAVLVVEGEVVDEVGTLATTSATVFVRGAGGFGGQRGPSGDEGPTPAGGPDHVVELETRADQAAIYRLSGDPNPLHIDPDVARLVGYDEPFLHGLCTFGIVGRAVLSALCDGDVSRFGGLSARFADQVYPGDTVITKIWRDGTTSAHVEASTQKGKVVLSRGRVSYTG
jgi:acyl dehydratase